MTNPCYILALFLALSLLIFAPLAIRRAARRWRTHQSYRRYLSGDEMDRMD
jgi:hypothetical protein